MKDMHVNELLTRRLIELLATVSFRIIGFQFVLLTFHYLCLLELDRSYLANSDLPTSYQKHSIQAYVTEITFHALTAVIMFVLSGPLARLICRGMFQTTNTNVTK